MFVHLLLHSCASCMQLAGADVSKEAEAAAGDDARSPAASTSSSSSAAAQQRYGRNRKYAVYASAPPLVPHVALRSPVNAAGLVEDWDMMESLLEYALTQRFGLRATATPAPSASAHANSNANAGGGASAPASSGGASTSSNGVSSSFVRSFASSAASASAPAHVDLKDHPLLFAEPALAAKADRERLCQLLFETYHCPGVFVGKSGVLALYANARTSGFAVDVGAGGISLTPVQEGFPLLAGVRRLQLGGRAMDAALQVALAAKLGALSASEASSASAAAAAGVSLPLHQLPPALIPRPLRVLPTAGTAAASIAAASAAAGLHRSLVSFHCLELAREVKEGVCRVAEDAPAAGAPAAGTASAASGAGAASAASSSLGSGGAAAAVPVGSYELPDGTLLSLAAERTAIPELLFDPAATFPGAPALHTAVVGSVMACEPEVRRELMAGLVLTGGGSALPGLFERLQRELTRLAPVGTRPRLAAAAPPERALGAWLGGSILGSMGNFHDLWFSASEYAEHGAKMVHRKCP
jgi:actin-like protein 6A